MPDAPVDLVAFLNARLDEDKAAAKAALEEVALTEGRDTRYPYPERLARCMHDGRHSPARVLREVEVKRKILALHQIEVVKCQTPPFDAFTGEPSVDEYDVTCRVCGWASRDPSSACPTLRALAAVWSDHPDYQQEWAFTG